MSSTYTSSNIAGSQLGHVQKAVVHQMPDSEIYCTVTQSRLAVK